MLDLLFVAIMAAFFGVAAAFVNACEKIVGQSASFEEGSAGTTPTEPAAPTGTKKERAA